MKLKLVKASQGLEWVKQGLLTLKRQPLGFIGLVGLSGMVAILLMSLPERLGALLVVGLMPWGWSGFMVATRRALVGERVTLGVFGEVLQAPQTTRRQFALLGLAYIVATVAVIALASALGPDADLIEQATSGTDDMAEVLANPLVQQDMLLRLALTLPVSLLFWHTPALILWARVPVAKALFFSAVASWRNLGAFTLYGLGWAGLMVALGLAMRLLLLVVPVPSLVDGVAMVAGMAVASAFYASLYFTVIDCFEPSDIDQPGKQPPADTAE